MLALAASLAHAQAQQFYNLTSEEVKIDSVLPTFATSRPLPPNHADSTYAVSIEWPEFIDMGEADIARYQAIAGTEPPPAMPVVEAGVGISRRRATLDIGFTPIAYRDGRYQKLVSFMLAVKATPNTPTPRRAKDAATRTATDAAARYADHSVLREGTWAKISVSQSGIHELTASLIRQAGFTDLSKVKVYGYGGALQPETLSGAYLASTDDLAEVPLCTVGGRRFFYAQGPVTWSESGSRTFNPYSDHGYYFITQGDDEPAATDSAAFLQEHYPAPSDYNALYEVDDYAWYAGGRNLYDSKAFAIGTPNTYALDAQPSATGTLTVALSAYSLTANSTATIALNGKEVGTASVNYLRDDTGKKYSRGASGTATFQVDSIAATNTVTITQTAGGTLKLDYIALHTTEPKAAPDLAGGSFPTPQYVYRITNQDHHADEAVDMVIIIPTTQKLLAQAERLKALHEQKDGMTVRIVPADELYNEFSSGTPDATAYRRYMKMLYDRAGDDESKMPRYLTLFGDGAWDNRMHLATWSGYSPDDFLLCYESENSYSAVYCFVSDDFFCMLDDGERLATETGGASTSTGKPDIAVGRFPVRTEAEAKTMVDKIEAYMNGDHAGAWQNTVVLMGDDGDNNTHMKAADDCATIVERHNPTIDVRRVMWDAYALETSSTGPRHPDAAKLIKQYMADGALVMNYNGHGAANSISHEYVLTLSDFKTTVSKRLPLWVTASCDIMPFDGQEETIGEQALLNENGGAVAFFGTTRTVYTDKNRAINMAFMKKLFEKDANGKRLTIGEAIRQAKVMLVESYTDETTKPNDRGDSVTISDRTQNKLQYSLLGDPALTLAHPLPSMAIDSINGVATTDGATHTFGAGSKVRVAGRVLSGGETDGLFNGTLTALAREGQQTVTCRLGAQADASQAFTFKEWQNQVYKGTDSIRAGRFSFTFVVPKDISYNDSAAQILVYALSSDKQQAFTGADRSLRFNGSGTLGKDSIGPSIYCYLNTSSFVNGGTVNASPYFVAEITDEDGINASGGGIGHDLQLVIDGEMTKTYSLNNYFTFDFGSYQSGTVGYQIPTLSEGDHKLRFQAWDVLNNASVAELSFRVQNGTAASIHSVEATKNPASSSTAFRIVTDRVGVELTARIELFDTAGRALWTRTVTDTPEGNTLTVDWDLTTNSGQRLGTGVYLYRAGISCEGSEYTTQTKKLIVIRNK